MKLSDYQHMFLLNVCKLIEFADVKGFKITGGDLYRSQEMQQKYYEEGKSKTLDSNHTKRMAIDLNFFWAGELTYSKNLLQEIGNFWESLHPKNRWGGNFKLFTDTPHFEMNI